MLILDSIILFPLRCLSLFLVHSGNGWAKRYMYHPVFPGYPTSSRQMRHKSDSRSKAQNKHTGANDIEGKRVEAENIQVGLHVILYIQTYTSKQCCCKWPHLRSMCVIPPPKVRNRIHRLTKLCKSFKFMYWSDYVGMGGCEERKDKNNGKRKTKRKGEE